MDTSRVLYYGKAVLYSSGCGYVSALLRSSLCKKAKWGIEQRSGGNPYPIELLAVAFAEVHAQTFTLASALCTLSFLQIFTGLQRRCTFLPTIQDKDGTKITSLFLICFEELYFRMFLPFATKKIASYFFSSILQNKIQWIVPSLLFGAHTYNVLITKKGSLPICLLNSLSHIGLFALRKKWGAAFSFIAHVVHNRTMEYLPPLPMSK